MPPGRKPEEWEELQKRIFTRWVNQKLNARHLPPINDVLTDIGQEMNLSNLILALTDKEMPKPAKLPPMKVRAQQVEWLGKQIDWCYEVGVPKAKLPPSASNIFDGDFSDIMGLLFNIMVRFLKFDDDDDVGGGAGGNAADALLRWCQFQTKNYKGVEVTNLKKSWADGLALCALVHKFAPESLDFSKLSAASPAKNVELAMDAANKFFNVEKFLEPREVGLLDDKGMLIFLSEYYYGINDWFKMQIAGKRIIKLVTFTRENDEARTTYDTTTNTLLTRLATAEGYLADIATVHNTMAGAKKNLEDYNKYKSSEKRQVTKLQLETLGIFNQLNLRLKNNKRPDFAPAAPTAPGEIAARVKALNDKEVIEPKLYAELERQVRLVEINSQHVTRSAKIDRFIAAQSTYLSQSLTATTSGDSRKLLMLFEGFVSELANVRTGVFPELQKTGAFLLAEKYEKINEVQDRENKIASGFDALTAGGNKNEPVLRDNLKREMYREGVLGKVEVHRDVFERLVTWGDDSTVYVTKQETIESTQEARIQLSTLDGFDVALKDMADGNVVRLNELGAEVRDAVYKTDISAWKYEKPDEIIRLEAIISSTYADLAVKAAKKREVLNDALAREELREQVALRVGNHAYLFADFESWCNRKLEYLGVKETCTNSLEARTALNALDQFCTEKKSKEAGDVVELIKLGDSIRSAKHDTSFSKWVYEKPTDVTNLETKAEVLIATLDKNEAQKRAILDDDLERELYAEETRLIAGRHVDKGVTCGKWATEKTTFMQSDVLVHSIREAEVGLSLLDAYDVEKARFTEVAVASLKRLGKDILARKYETKFSKYIFEHRDEVVERETTIDGHWKTLDELSLDRRSTLEKLKAREERKESLRIEYADAAGDLIRLCDDAVSVIGNEAEQQIMFGFSLKEVTTYRSELDAYDNAVNAKRESKKGDVAKIVAEMTSLVKQTKDFDTAQAEGVKDAEAVGAADDADETLTSPEPTAGGGDSPNRMRKTRFNTLTKGFRKAFTKKKRSTEALAVVAIVETDEDTPWPEVSNPYSDVTVGDLTAKSASLTKAQEARQGFYGAELKRWTENEAACKAFADAVSPAQARIKAMTVKMMANQGKDEDQLADVETALTALNDEESKLATYSTLSSTVDSRGITTNPFTTLTVEDVRCELENVKQIAEQKQPYLHSIIAFKKYKGISPEQYELMETLYKESDTDKTNSISPKELRACLFSLGEERSKIEISQYMKEYGKNNQLDFNQFRELMIVLIGDTGNKDSTTESFKLIARGLPIVMDKDLIGGAPAVPPTDVAYFGKEAPEKDGGHVYGPWIDAVFAR